MSMIVWPDSWPDDARNVCAGWMAKYGEARDALEALVDWEGAIDAEYLDEKTIAEYNADMEHAKSVLAKHPRPYLDTGGKWTS